MKANMTALHPGALTLCSAPSMPLLDRAVVPDRPSAQETLQVISVGAWESAAAHCQLKSYSMIAVVSDSILDQHFGEYLRKCFGDALIYIDGSTLKKKGEISCGAYIHSGVDVIIGLGGGTNIDQAKMIAKYSDIPWMALPTKPTAAILSGHASVVINGKRVSEQTPIAEAVFIDKALFRQLDPLCAKSEFGDSLSSLTAVGDAYLSSLDRGTFVKAPLLRKAYRVASDTLEIDDLRSSEGILELYRSNLRYADIMTDYNSSLPCSGSEHAVSHALDTLGSKQLHGIQVGFTTLVGSHLQSSCGDLRVKFQREGISQVCTEQLQVTLKKRGFPTRLSELGISRDCFENALHIAPTVRAANDRRYTVLERYEVSDAMRKLAQAGLV